MLKLIIGKKGSGKTKKLIDLVTAAADASDGNVVCVEKGDTLTYNITHRVRLVDADHYSVSGFDAFYGFLSGICAGNYDLTHVYVDAVLRICSRDFDELAKFFEKIEALSKISDTEFTFTVSCDESDIPASVFEFAEKI
jgi:hypothetical protein